MDKQKKNNKKYKLLNILEFGQLNNKLNYDNNLTDFIENKFVKDNSLLNKKKKILSPEFKTKNYNKKEIKKSNKNSINNKTIKSTNPFIQNEVIWYSNDLNSEELEQKFKNKNYNINNEIKNNDNDYNINNNHQIKMNNKEKINDIYDKTNINENIINNINNNINENHQIKINNLKLDIISETSKMEKYFTYKPDVTMVKNLYKKNLDCKICIFPLENQTSHTSIKKYSNIFEWNINSDTNYLTYKIFNNNLEFGHLKDMFFIVNSKQYNPKIVEIYINDVFIKKIYSEVFDDKIVNDCIDNNNQNNYTICDSTYPLCSSTRLKIIIKDDKEIENVFFKIFLEKVEEINKNYFIENNEMKFLSNTHELLYEGIDSDIIINEPYGYYQDIYIVCANIENNIQTISLTNTDAVLLSDVPTQLLSYNKNVAVYSLKILNQIISGLKISDDNWLDIKLKKNPNSKIKIFGNKLFFIKKN